jgi:hypothetical protein
VVALLGFEGTDDGVSAQKSANNGTWLVSCPDTRAAHTGAQGLYVEVTKAWGVASLAQVLLPRYVPRAGKETLLHLGFYARAERLKATDPVPIVTVVFMDLQANNQVLGRERVSLSHADWQMHYVVIDLKTERVGRAKHRMTTTEAQYSQRCPPEDCHRERYLCPLSCPLLSSHSPFLQARGPLDPAIPLHGRGARHLPFR